VWEEAAIERRAVTETDFFGSRERNPVAFRLRRAQFLSGRFYPATADTSGKKFQVRVSETAFSTRIGAVRAKEVTMPDPDSASGRRLPRLLDIAGVAEHLAVSERHVRRLVAERRIPYVKWGHLLRFDPDEIAEWLDGGRRRPA
jgi:excisionase family DNA binding protein